MISKMKVFTVIAKDNIGGTTNIMLAGNNPISIEIGDEIEIWMVFQGRLKTKRIIKAEPDNSDEEDENEDIKTDDSKLKDFNIFGS